MMTHSPDIVQPLTMSICAGYKLPLRADITADEAVTVLQHAELREKKILEGYKEQSKCERIKLEIAQL